MSKWDSILNSQVIGPIPFPLSRVVVVVVVDIARRLRYSYSWRATSDTW